MKQTAEGWRKEWGLYQLVVYKRFTWKLETRLGLTCCHGLRPNVAHRVVMRRLSVGGCQAQQVQKLKKTPSGPALYAHQPALVRVPVHAEPCACCFEQAAFGMNCELQVRIITSSLLGLWALAAPCLPWRNPEPPWPSPIGAPEGEVVVSASGRRNTAQDKCPRDSSLPTLGPCPEGALASQVYLRSCGPLIWQ